MGAASRSVAVQSFRDDAILDQYEAVYRRAGVLR